MPLFPTQTYIFRMTSPHDIPVTSIHSATPSHLHPSSILVKLCHAYTWQTLEIMLSHLEAWNLRVSFSKTSGVFPFFSNQKVGLAENISHHRINWSHHNLRCLWSPHFTAGYWEASSCCGNPKVPDLPPGACETWSCFISSQKCWCFCFFPPKKKGKKWSVFE